MLARPPVILRLLDMGAIIENYHHGRTRIGDRPCKTARRSKTRLLEKAVLRGRKWGAGSGELLNEEAWGDGRRWQCEPSVWCSHSCVIWHRGTFTATKALAMKCSKWIKCQEYSIEWFSRSGLSSISDERIGEVAKSSILKQIWTKCSYHFEES